MKKILLALFLFAQGCTLSASSGSDVVSSGECPASPTSFPSSDRVKQIALNEGTQVQESGQVSSGRPQGYTFKGEAGQTLKYNTSDACVWLYSPENTLVNDNQLSLEGNYMVQVAIPQGSTSYTLNLELVGNEPVAAPVVSGNDRPSNPLSTNASSSSNTSNSSTSSSNTSSSNATSNNPAGLSQSDAEALVKKWLNAKSDIFAPPFNRRLADELTTGVLNNDITKRNGSIDWLRNNGSYYEYRNSEITNVQSYSSDGVRPVLKLSIYESRVLFKSNGQRDAAQSGASTETFTYYFTKENGTWKIDDYK